MWVLVIVASCVLSVFEKVGIVGILFGFASGQVSLSLLGDNVGDECFLGIEVVFHRGGFVFAAGVFEYGFTHDVAD